MVQGCINCSATATGEYELVRGTDRFRLWLCERCRTTVLTHDWIEGEAGTAD